MPTRSLFAELAWLVLRISSGAFLAFDYGYAKVFGGKVVGLAGYLAGAGWPFPHFLAWCAALTELLGGLLVALGLATRGAAALVCFVMLVALWSQHRAPWQEWERPLLYFAMFFNFAAAGGGRFGLDHFLRLRFPVGPR